MNKVIHKMLRSVAILLHNDRKSRHRGSKGNVAMNGWLPQASYHFSDTSS